MVPAWKVDAIRLLLADDRLSQREIARQSGVSRGVVAGIADGTRPDYAALRPPVAPVAPLPVQPAGRCPQCGAMVEFPCIACRARLALARAGRPRTRPAAPGDEGLRLMLIETQRVRYEEVRARRMNSAGWLKNSS
jgi:hypothetical protein